ncbi:SusC/RagA family TonB-linked outer membrane protein [Gaetbulibacter saemankumensis]|uniref:SusC/RagA family TonB-linked outer membrane protein n=1 Tax=Gaetbulibacter saemankumensis TaxID=311208 RepID=UPI00040A97DC|nr:SusC/RagA family TonB-linked outer membrane protein [Gaetbulibacter saemankumensis]
MTYSVMAQNQNTAVTIKNQDSTVLKNALVQKLVSETIYTGNGMQIEKQKLTSAINKVSGEELEKTNSFNPANSLYGLLPGLMVLQNGGNVGARDPDLFIRGLNTLNNNSILILVDGIQTDIGYLNTQSIESVEVLKDAAALAIYGQRGANGVLLITTKTGVKQKMDVSLSYQSGITTAVGYPDFLDASGYALSVNQARELDGLSPLYSPAAIQAYKDGSLPDFYPNVNWINESMRGTGTKMNLNAAFRGGDDSMTYYAAINYQAENGLYNDRGLEEYATQSKYDRVNFISNLNVKLTSTTQLDARLLGAIDELYSPGSSYRSIMDAMYGTPANAFPVRNYKNVYGGTNIYGNNPVAMINSTGYEKNQATNIGIGGTLKQDLGSILEGLSADFTVGHFNRATSIDGQTKTYLYEELTRNETTLDTISQTYSEDSALRANSGNGFLNRYTNFFGKLNYEKQVDNHEFNSFLMFAQDKYVGKGQYTTYLRQNLAGNFHYGYKDKYLVDVTLSYAGSSVLPKDRFEFYPAVSSAWVISNEDFIKEDSWIKYLKLRASFGYAGNDRIQQNTEDQRYGSVGNYFFTRNNNASWSSGEGRLGGNPKMEKAMMTNIGLDVNLFRKLNLTVDAFYNKRTNILVFSDGQTSNLLGVGAPVLPNGEVTNRGLEASLTWQESGKDFNYAATAMFSYSKNRIEEMSETPRPYDYMKRTGHSIGQAFGLVSDGFFNSQADIDNSNPQLFSLVSPGDIKYVDQNGDNVIDNFDQVALGYSTSVPEMYFSLNLNAEYKGLGVNAIFQGIANQSVLLNTQNVYWPLINNANITTFSNNAWTPSTAATATLPRLTTLDNDNNYRSNDIWLKDGGYVKLRTLEFYFNLPQQFVNKYGVNEFKIFARGTNLFSWDSIEQMDPEALSTTYPLLKTLSLGLDFTF